MVPLGAIEAGGTKFLCIVANESRKILAETRFSTTTPEQTLARSIEFFNNNSPIQALGIASFGPLDLEPTSKQYGYITTTPKSGWNFINVLGIIQQALGVPAYIDTDVNAAALSEAEWGAGIGLQDVLYLTIGTGIGGGCVIHGAPLHGLIHPEMGHMRIPHDFQRDPFKGCCPYHQDCFEGLASGTAINLRWQAPAESFPPDHPAWALEAEYIALAINNLICTHSPQKIILGGGVMQQNQLFPMIRKRVESLLNQYIQSPAVLSEIDDYIVPPLLGNRAGVLGGLALALRGLKIQQ